MRSLNDPRRKDITGKRSGRLVALRRVLAVGPSVWVCACDCGAEVIVKAAYIINGHTLSCGCYRRDNISKRKRKHGFALKGNVDLLYKTWLSMRGRCANAAQADYARYGGRGITVCARWDDFEAFRDDVGPRPSPAHSLDRIDNNGNYEPGNVRWATAAEQGRNKRNNVRLSLNGETLLLAEWEARTGISAKILDHRIRRGWSAERALTQTPSHSRRNIPHARSR